MRMARAQEAETRGGREGGSIGLGGGGGELQPIHAAWRALLDTWLPALLEECNFAASFLQLYEPPADGDADAEGAPPKGTAAQRSQGFNKGHRAAHADWKQAALQARAQEPGRLGCFIALRTRSKLAP